MAAAAIATGGAPTGWGLLDVVLLAALGAGAVLAGLRCSPWVTLLAAIAAAVFGIGSAALPLGLAASGLVFASLYLQAEPVLNALATGLVAQAALRLARPGGRGLTALVAALILIPVAVSAIAALRRDDRRRILRVALVAGAFAVVGAVGGAVAAWSAVGPLRKGLSTATSSVAGGPGSSLGGTAAQLADAGRQFSKARHALEAWWARPARAVPVVAQQWRVLRAAALTGDQLSAAGQRALSAPPLADISISQGQIPLDQLAAIGPPVADVAGRMTAARSRLDSARSAWLVPPLREKLGTELQRVRDAERTTQTVNRAMPLLPALLGRDGARHYFLALQTPNESRAGGGFLGNYGEITADRGRLDLTRFGRQDDLNFAPGRTSRRLVAPDEFVARYGRFSPQTTWSNVNLSPDFPTDAAVIAGLYPQSGGEPVDGVIAVDPAGLTALLSLVGPIHVASWPVDISAGNAMQVLLYDQYLTYQGFNERVDFLGDVAQEAWRRLTSGSLPPLPQVLSSLGPVVRTKHLFLASTRPDEQRLFEQMGASGKVAPVKGDFLGLVTQNASGNKIDYFLRRQVDYHVALSPGSGKLTADVKVTLHNDAPASGLPITLIGNQVPDQGLPDGNNRLYLSFYTPWKLVEGRLDGAPVQLEQATELGRRVYSAAIVVPSKGSATLELRLTGRLADATPYRLDVYRQPMVAPDDVHTALAVGAGWQVGGGGRKATSDRRLEADTTIEVPLRRR
jgi:hypothetical protein